MNITPSTARRWVLLSIVALLGMAAYRGALTGQGGFFHRLWGVGMLGLMLSAAADFAPSLAGPFALLVAMGYATSGGDKAIENLLGKVSGGGAAPPPAGHPSAGPPPRKPTPS